MTSFPYHDPATGIRDERGEVLDPHPDAADIPARAWRIDSADIERFTLRRLENARGDFANHVTIERQASQEPLPVLYTHHGDWSLSPETFAWGYRGPEPLDLALNLLSTLVEPHEAWRQHEAFMLRFLAPMPVDGGTIDVDEIHEWLRHVWHYETADLEEWWYSVERIGLDIQTLRRVRNYIGRLTPLDRARWALTLIQQGRYAPNFRQLFGMEYDDSEQTTIELLRLLQVHTHLAARVDPEYFPLAELRDAYRDELAAPRPASPPHTPAHPADAEPSDPRVS